MLGETGECLPKLVDPFFIKISDGDARAYATARNSRVLISLRILDTRVALHDSLYVGHTVVRDGQSLGATGTNDGDKRSDGIRGEVRLLLQDQGFKRKINYHLSCPTSVSHPTFADRCRRHLQTTNLMSVPEERVTSINSGTYAKLC